MCWKCDAMAPQCPNVTLPDWMYRTLKAFPPRSKTSDDFPPLDPQTTAFYQGDFGHPEEHKKGSPKAAEGLNLTAKTGTSGPKPEIPGAIGFSDFFCL